MPGGSARQGCGSGDSGASAAKFRDATNSSMSRLVANPLPRPPASATTGGSTGGRCGSREGAPTPAASSPRSLLADAQIQAHVKSKGVDQRHVDAHRSSRLCSVCPLPPIPNPRGCRPTKRVPAGTLSTFWGSKCRASRSLLTQGIYLRKVPSRLRAPKSLA